VGLPRGEEETQSIKETLLSDDKPQTRKFVQGDSDVPEGHGGLDYLPNASNFESETGDKLQSWRFYITVENEEARRQVWQRYKELNPDQEPELATLTATVLLAYTVAGKAPSELTVHPKIVAANVDNWASVLAAFTDAVYGDHPEVTAIVFNEDSIATASARWSKIQADWPKVHSAGLAFDLEEIRGHCGMSAAIPILLPPPDENTPVGVFPSQEQHANRMLWVALRIIDPSIVARVPKDFDPVGGDPWPDGVMDALIVDLRRRFPGGLRIAVFVPQLTTLRVQTENRLKKNHKDLIDWGCATDGTFESVLFYSRIGPS
jgi:hypothetical protein